MNITHLRPQPTNSIPFKLSEYKLTPKKSGCYVLASVFGEVLYIGQSTNLYQRFIQHLDCPKKTGITSLGKVIWFYFFECEIIELNMLERSWTNKFLGHHAVLPELNKISPPI